MEAMEVMEGLVLFYRFIQYDKVEVEEVEVQEFQVKMQLVILVEQVNF